MRVVNRKRIRLGPRSVGRAIRLSDFERADFRNGYVYELIEGRLSVLQFPECSHELAESGIRSQLLFYTVAHPEAGLQCFCKSLVYVHGRQPSCLRPDITLIGPVPSDIPKARLRWKDLDPVIVVEVTSPECAAKDFVRNVRLYLAEATIREYWILSDLENPGYPMLTVYRKRAKKWQKPIVVAPGQTYTTRLLPGLELKLDSPTD